ncbi:putative wall-associated receptor kinase-like 16 [Prosopis cineraria]|uniref:putative wall-associated receptor kinase-like 16 n=1 Tax=Prosopis cineraria TaxID=364024 RepID=UPI00240F0935|nr:putative wall-associated receptor kinase-like 16 [Prosopis cineraria]
MGLSLLLLIKLSLVASTLASPAPALAAAKKAGCDTMCGDVKISYPFGTTKDCFKDPDFLITCSTSSRFPVPYLGTKNNIRVLNISGETSELLVFTPVYHDCYDPDEGIYWTKGFRAPSKFAISNTKNDFVVVGCNTYAFFYDIEEQKLFGCNSECSYEEPLAKGSCSGAGCCRTNFGQPIRNYTNSIVFYGDRNVSDGFLFNCSYAFFAKHGTFNFSDSDLHDLSVRKRSTVVLNWGVDQTKSCGGACKDDESICEESQSVKGYYLCKCKPGFEGNPYLSGGCKDVDECHGINNCTESAVCTNYNGSYTCTCPSGQKGNGLKNETGPGSGCRIPDADSNHDGRVIIISLVVAVALLVVLTVLFALCWAQKKRSLRQLRKRNFEQNGGNLLLQQFSQRQYTERAKIFTEDELKNATNNFDESRILGRGGQGTVYKGTLSNNTHVAIKKSKVGGDSQNIKSFINEVFVLSQINHRNVVKLLGCCLETEVPLLVYEFVDNGTLLDHLSPSKNYCSITWETRLRIAIEIAGAISYLHSAASIPIIHRDIKSANILLDHDNRAKVSDFGASRLVHLDKTQVATVIQGTIGYLDPEYLQTGQLNEKSDVYSFGIVLVELLTGKKAFEFNGLTSHFISSMREDCLWEILDKRVLDPKKNAKQLKEVASLARRCIRVNGEERPTMKEVAMELEALMAMEKNLQGKDKDMMVEESEYLVSNFPNDGYESASASISVVSYDSIQKQVPFEIVDGGR